MKYMNNHFGQSRIFGNARCKIPVNLQFFGETGESGDAVSGGGAGSGDQSGSGGESGEDDSAPTVEELVAQLAAERAKSARLQNEKDTASSEAAKFKKQLRAKMTADEQAEAAKSEAEAEKDARIQELESKFRLMDYSKRYMGVGMDEKSANEIAELTGEIEDVDKFFSALDKFVKAAVKRGSEDYVQTIIKNGGSINAGNGDGSKESEAVRIARESAARRANKGFNEDALKQWM